jgi:hypothetical protein
MVSSIGDLLMTRAQVIARLYLHKALSMIRLAITLSETGRLTAIRALCCCGRTRNE